MRITAQTKGRLPPQLERRRQSLDDDVAGGVRQLVRLAHGQVLARAPHGPSGNYIAGIETHSGGPRGSVGATAAHSSLVEKGREPGKAPPVAKMAALFRIPRARAFVLARAIGRHGTEGHHVFRDAARAAGQHVERIMIEAVTRR